MFDEYREIIDRNIGILAALEYREQAEPRYCTLGDMVYWEDEVVDAPRELVNCMRVILHFRMGFSSPYGDAGAGLVQYLKDRVPSWPGARPERCDRVRLARLYEELKEPVEELPD